MTKRTEQILQCFVKKHKELAEFSFLDSVKEIKCILSNKPNMYGQYCYVEGLSNEQISAFLFVFRMFIQDKDNISVRNIEDAILNESGISRDIKERISNLRKSLNSYLDDFPDSLVLLHKDFSPTRRDILRIILYGALCHVEFDKKEKAIYDKWLKLPFNPRYIDLEFYQILNKCFMFIEAIADIIEKKVLIIS